MNYFNPTRDFTILGDGNTIAIIMGKDAYVLTDPIMQEFNQNIHQQIVNVTTMGGDEDFIKGSEYSTVEIILRTGKTQIMEADKIQLDFAQNMTIMGLLAAINKKVEERNV